MASDASSSPDEVEELRARLDVAVQRFRRQEQFTEWILRASLEGFHLVGMNGEILDCNESFAALVGYAADLSAGGPVRRRRGLRPRA